MVELSEKTKQELAMAVGRLLGVPYASEKNKILKAARGQGLEDVIPVQFALEYEVLPLFQSGGFLAIAMVSPQDTKLVAKIKRMAGLEIELYITTRAQLLRAIKNFYRSGSGPGSGGTAGRPVRPPVVPPKQTDAAAKELPKDDYGMGR